MSDNTSNDQNNQLALPDDAQIAQTMESLQTVRDGLQFFEQLASGEIAPEEGQVENAIALMKQSSAQLEAFHAQYAATMGGVKAVIETLQQQRNEAMQEMEDLRDNFEEAVGEALDEHLMYYGDESYAEGLAAAFEDYENVSEHIQQALLDKADAYAARLRDQGKLDEAERIEQLTRQAAATLKLADEANAVVEQQFRQEDAEAAQKRYEQWRAEIAARAAANGGTAEQPEYDDDDDFEGEEEEYPEGA